MTEQGLHRLKSSFAREIFKQDLLQVYDRQTEHRNALARESRDMLSEIVEQINTDGYDNETVELIARLSQIFWDDLRRDENVRRHIDKKLWQKIAEKKEQHGQKME